MPQYRRVLKAWFGTFKNAQAHLSLQDMNDRDFQRVLRGEASRPEEVERVAKAVAAYAKRYKLPGWEELKHG